MTTVYISGPITGYPDYNKNAFIRAEERLTKGGFTVVNPLRINHVLGSNNEIIVSPTQYHMLTREQYLKNDIVHLINCQYIYFIDGWETSRGAVFEKIIADELKIPHIL